ncbi:hypothetical protein JHK87_019461 [Glycine soja]|nr:hypothetical protein JHK87_019461 [Glycine soja]
MDLILRIIAAIATLGSALGMGTTRQTLPFPPKAKRVRKQILWWRLGSTIAYALTVVGAD